MGNASKLLGFLVFRPRAPRNLVRVQLDVDEAGFLKMLLEEIAVEERRACAQLFETLPHGVEVGVVVGIRFDGVVVTVDGK